MMTSRRDRCGPWADPIHQFKIRTSFFPVVKIAGQNRSTFTNSAFYMLLTVRPDRGPDARPHGGGGAWVPTRIASRSPKCPTNSSPIRSEAPHRRAGPQVSSPLVFSLFMFILVSNVIGLIPFTFHGVEPHHRHRVRSLLLVFFTVIVYGFLGRTAFGFLRPVRCRGGNSDLHHGRLIVVHRAPCRSCPRPILATSVRLFANMLAGHITPQAGGELRDHDRCIRVPRLGRRHAAARVPRFAPDRASNCWSPALQAYVFTISDLPSISTMRSTPGH